MVVNNKNRMVVRFPRASQRYSTRNRPHATCHRMLQSAYRQLDATEKAFVDGYVRDLEREAARTFDRLSNALYRDVPSDVVEASRGLLARPLVTAAIHERVTDLARDQEITRDRIVREIGKLAFSNISDFGRVENDGSFTADLSNVTKEQTSCIESIDVEESFTNSGVRKKTRIKLHNKVNALLKLAEYAGIVADSEHWKAANARPVVPSLPDGVTVEQASDYYARMLGE